MNDLVVLTPEQTEYVAGGYYEGGYHDPPEDNSWTKWLRDRMWGSHDSDGDGVPDHSDRMDGGNDRLFHLHGSDGTIMGENPDGTFTLFDPNGNASQTKWSLVGVSQDTGGSASGGVTATGGNISYSTDGNTYSFTPIGR